MLTTMLNMCLSQCEVAMERLASKTIRTRYEQAREGESITDRFSHRDAYVAVETDNAGDERVFTVRVGIDGDQLDSDPPGTVRSAMAVVTKGIQDAIGSHEYTPDFVSEDGEQKATIKL